MVKQRCSYPDCKKKFSSKTDLKDHLEAVHDQFNVFECKKCHKVLSSKQNLKEHMYLHSSSMPYECDYPGCTAKFRQTSQLSNHKKHKHDSSRQKKTATSKTMPFAVLPTIDFTRSQPQRSVLALKTSHDPEV